MEVSKVIMNNPKFVFITGGVISGLGKGIIAASVAHLLEEEGYKTAPIKADPYLNLDAGTMNPIIHGETFVTEDGLETDQDIGHYERFIDRNLTRLNYMTAGQVFLKVIENERQMKYKGECVEFIRHIPEEIIRRLRELGKKTKSEIIVLEVGGTVGDIQNTLFLEALRQLKLTHPDDVIIIHVAYLPLPKNLGELKTKPVQQSVYFLHNCGVQPDIIVTRSEKEIDNLRKEKISIFCNVKKEDIISSPDLSTVYLVPDCLRRQNIVARIKTKLKLCQRKKNLTLIRNWSNYINKIKQAKSSQILIGIVGKYFRSGDYTLEDSYVCVLESIRQAFYWHNLKPNIVWISSEDIEKKGFSLLKKFSGLIVPQGWGSRGVEGKVLAARFCRENNIPYLGLCFGMQLASIEFARNVLGYRDANSTEIDPQTKHPVIHIMPHQLAYLKKRQYGGTIRLGAWPTVIKKHSLLWRIYEKYKNKNYSLPYLFERHRHRYEFNNKFRNEFEKNGVIFSATSADNQLIEAIELKNHCFFLGVQYHPEFKSRPLTPHPIFLAFIDTCLSVQTCKKNIK